MLWKKGYEKFQNEKKYINELKHYEKTNSSNE